MNAKARLGLVLWALAMGAGAAPAEPPSVERGAKVYKLWCWNCHGSGPGKPGTAALQTAYGGNPPAVLEQRQDLIPEHVRHVVRHGQSMMPFSRKTEISDSDLDAIVLYLTRAKAP